MLTKRATFFPHEFFYRILTDDRLKKYYQIDPKIAGLRRECRKQLPMFVPGWEDSTLGNMYAGHCISGGVQNVHTVRTGIEYMVQLADWYTTTSASSSTGFFQIAGGIAGDFPICVVPMLHPGICGRERVFPRLGYFCQISDSTTSYGSLLWRGAEREITWGKLSLDTPKYVIESDATIVAPLIFAWILGW